MDTKVNSVPLPEVGTVGSSRHTLARSLSPTRPRLNVYVYQVFTQSCLHQSPEPRTMDGKKYKQKRSDIPSSMQENALILAETPSEDESAVSARTQWFDARSNPLPHPASSPKPAAATGYHDNQDKRKRHKPRPTRGTVPRRGGQSQESANDVSPAKQEYKMHQKTDELPAGSRQSFPNPDARCVVPPQKEPRLEDRLRNRLQPRMQSGIAELPREAQWATVNPFVLLPDQLEENYRSTGVQHPAGRSPIHYPRDHHKHHFDINVRRGNPHDPQRGTQRGNQSRPRRRSADGQHALGSTTVDPAYDYWMNPGMESHEGSNHNVLEGYMYRQEVGGRNRRHTREHDR